MPDPHSNFGYSTVATAPSPASSGTSLVVQAADGVKFPTGGSFNATVWPVSAQPTAANAEIVRVTAISTDTFTITRAQESTSARTIVVGDQISATITAKTLTDVELEGNYLTSMDQSVPANTQAIFDDYLELTASFVYEVASGAELVVGSYATPLPLPDQNTNISISVADETIPRNSEVVFSDFYELSAPFATEVAPNGEIQLGTNPDIVGPFLPGFRIGYDQITATVNIGSTTEATGTTIIACSAHMFDGSLVRCEFFTPLIQSGTSGGSQTIVSLFEATTQIARLGFIQTPAAAQMGVPIDGVFYFSPTAGLHTYTVTAFSTNITGTPAISAGSGGTGGNAPTYIAFFKV